MSSGLVTKNSELLPSTPLLAMASRPLEVNRKSAFNSTGIVLPVPAPFDAALVHEILDDPVERGVRVGARVDQVDEVTHRVGRVVVEQLEVHLAQVGDDLQDLVGLRHERCRQMARWSDVVTV